MHGRAAYSMSAAAMQLPRNHYAATTQPPQEIAWFDRPGWVFKMLVFKLLVRMFIMPDFALGAFACIRTACSCANVCLCVRFWRTQHSAFQQDAIQLSATAPRQLPRNLGS